MLALCEVSGRCPMVAYQAPGAGHMETICMGHLMADGLPVDAVPELQHLAAVGGVPALLQAAGRRLGGQLPPIWTVLPLTLAAAREVVELVPGLTRTELARLESVLQTLLPHYEAQAHTGGQDAIDLLLLVQALLRYTRMALPRLEPLASGFGDLVRVPVLALQHFELLLVAGLKEPDAHACLPAWLAAAHLAQGNVCVAGAALAGVLAMHMHVVARLQQHDQRCSLIREAASACGFQLAHLGDQELHELVGGAAGELPGTPEQRGVAAHMLRAAAESVVRRAEQLCPDGAAAAALRTACGLGPAVGAAPLPSPGQAPADVTRELAEALKQRLPLGAQQPLEQAPGEGQQAGAAAGASRGRAAAAAGHKRGAEAAAAAARARSDAPAKPAAGSPGLPAASSSPASASQQEPKKPRTARHRTGAAASGAAAAAGAAADGAPAEHGAQPPCPAQPHPSHSTPPLSTPTPPSAPAISAEHAQLRAAIAYVAERRHQHLLEEAAGGRAGALIWHPSTLPQLQMLGALLLCQTPPPASGERGPTDRQLVQHYFNDAVPPEQAQALLQRALFG